MVEVNIFPSDISAHLMHIIAVLMIFPSFYAIYSKRTTADAFNYIPYAR